MYHPLQLIGKCFYIAIPCWDDGLMEERTRIAPIVENATQLLLHNQIDGFDFCDLVEDSIEDMDSYLDEIIENLDELF